MADDVFLGIDLGTSGVRCVAFTADLQPIASRHVPLHLETGDGGRVEQDAEAWWSGLLDVTSAVVAHLPAASNVRAMAVSSQGITVVPVDRDGRPLARALSWLDARADPLMGELAAVLDRDRLAEGSGMPFHAGYTLPKLFWLHRHEPGLTARAKLRLPLDFVTERLAGRPVLDRTMAAGTMAYDLIGRGWDPSSLSAVGVRVDQMPEIAEAGTIAGPLDPGVAAQLGLAPDVVVAVGAQDQKCAALAAGAGPDALTLSLGTAAALSSVSLGEAPPATDLPRFPFVEEGSWVVEASVLTAGAAYRWFADVIQAGFAELGDLASAAHRSGSASRPLFLPDLATGSTEAGQRWGVEPGGVFWGMTLDTSLGDLALSVLEGVTFDIDRLRRRVGHVSGSIRVFGGGAQSALWRQLLADASGLPVEALETHETAAAGAAMLAMRAVGQPAPSGVRVASRTDPGEGSARLQERAEAYQGLADRIRGTSAG